MLAQQLRNHLVSAKPQILPILSRMSGQLPMFWDKTRSPIALGGCMGGVIYCGNSWSVHRNTIIWVCLLGSNPMVAVLVLRWSDNLVLTFSHVSQAIFYWWKVSNAEKLRLQTLVLVRLWRVTHTAQTPVWISHHKVLVPTGKISTDNYHDTNACTTQYYVCSLQMWYPHVMHGCDTQSGTWVCYVIHECLCSTM